MPKEQKSVPTLIRLVAILAALLARPDSGRPIAMLPRVVPTKP